MIKIGQRVTFRPMNDVKLCDFRDDSPVEGVVTYINEPHRWFMAEYGNGVRVRTGFKFSDIGGRVKLVKEE